MNQDPQSSSSLLNPNPIINYVPIQHSEEFLKHRSQAESNDDLEDEVDKYEIYDLIKDINDPEHPLTLEQINVVQLDNIIVNQKTKHITVYFTPTIPNCTMSAVIGLSIKVKLLNSVSRKYKIDVLIEKGKHITEDAINKQLSDKERVYAALETQGLRRIIYKCIENDSENDLLYI